jgi:hypothetical protein
MHLKKLGKKQQPHSMRDKKPKIRVIVRPWTPRKIPYLISFLKVNEIIQEARPNIKSIIYVGWARRKIGDKRKLQYLVATGDTASETRNRFKYSNQFGENIWVVEP